LPFLPCDGSVLWSPVTEEWSDIIYLRLYFFSLFFILNYLKSFAKNFLIVMCNKLSTGERDAGKVEEYFWMHLKACRKSPKPILFYLELRYKTGCWMSK